jgi:sugar phosphate isomerase/epimerase
MSANEILLSLNQLTARDLTLADSARAARDCGFQGMGILPSSIAQLGVEKVRRILDDEGLQPTSVCAVIGLVETTATASARRLADAKRCLEYAALLKAPLVVVVGGPTPNITRRAAWERAVAAVGALLDTAAQLGVEVLVEPLHPALIGQSVATSLQDALTLVERTPTAGIVLDTWHVWWDSRLEDCVRDAASRIRIVHLSDWADPPNGTLDRVLPGEGVSDLPGLCADLLDSGFTGWWEVEVLSEALWAGDQTALVRAANEAATAVLSKAKSIAGGRGGNGVSPR